MNTEEINLIIMKSVALSSHKEALSWFRLMKKSSAPGLAPNLDTYRLVLTSLGELGKVEKMMGCFYAAASEVRVQHNLISAVMKGLMKNGHSLSAVLFFRRAFRLPLPAHLHTLKDREDMDKMDNDLRSMSAMLHSKIFRTEISIDLGHASGHLISLALECCAQGTVHLSFYKLREFFTCMLYSSPAWK